MLRIDSQPVTQAMMDSFPIGQPSHSQTVGSNALKKTELKREEQIAEQYFKSKGFSTIIYEPDGNVPPDFLLDNEVAVEVRRLNQHWEVNGISEPLENLEFDLISRFMGLLKSYESVTFDKSAFVNIEFSRPISSTKDIIKIIKTKLDEQLKDIHQQRTYQISRNVKIEVFPATSKLKSPFNLAFQMDNDGGGFVVGNIYDSLKIIVEEKQRKIMKYRTKYNQWWLALVDFIGYGIDKNDLEQLSESLDFHYDFAKIIFIPPLKPERAVELIKK